MADPEHPAVTWAKALLGEHHQPETMTAPALRELLARTQRSLYELIELAGQGTAVALVRIEGKFDALAKMIRIPGQEG